MRIVVWLPVQLVVGEFDVTRTFRLRNPSEVAVRFRMETLPPFSVSKAKQKVWSSSSTSAGTLVLQPRDTMQVKKTGDNQTNFMERK